MVGHASVLLEAGSVRLLTDPWLRGLAFADSWAQHPDPVLLDEQRDRLTHLWISHEHPDHLSIPTIKSLPTALKARLSVLTQRHLSSHVYEFLSGQGFAEVTELTHGRWTGLPGGLQVVSHQVGHEDSSMAFRDGTRTVLNLNDCKMDTASLQRIHRTVGPVDVLLDQYSVAGWTGNPGDHEEQAAHHAEALSTLLRHVDLLQPRHLVPFASSIRFAHEESAHHNLAQVSLDHVAAHVGPGRLVVLMPGDSWDLAEQAPPLAPALERARQAAAQVEGLPLQRSETVPLDALLSTVDRGLEALRGSFHRVLLTQLPPLRLWVDDLDTAVQVEALGQARAVPLAADECHLLLSSSAAAAAFASRWGLPTLLISGRYRTTPHGDRSFARWKSVGALHASGFRTRELPKRLTERRGREFVTRRWRDVPPQFLAKAV